MNISLVVIVTVGWNSPDLLKFIIRNNEIDTVYYTNSEFIETPYSKTLEYAQPLQIASLFQTIEDDIRKNPDSYSVSYDENYFYPKEAYFDFEYTTADEEVGYFIKELSFDTE